MVAGARVRVLAATAVMLALPGAAGCQSLDPDQAALDLATERVRDQARTSAAAMQAVLRERTAPADQALLHSLEQAVTVPGYGVGTVFDRAAGSAEGIRLDVAFDQAGEVRHARMLVRLCVRITGRPGPEAEAVMDDVACGPALPTHTDLGTVDRVVSLSD